jgi:hypothetical protein
MNKIWFGLALAVMVARPATAQDYHKNFVECTKQLGLQADAGNPYKLSDGRLSRRWYFHNEAQEATFSDCVARKASPGSSAAPRPRRPMS